LRRRTTYPESFFLFKQEVFISNYILDGSDYSKARWLTEECGCAGLLYAIIKERAWSAVIAKAGFTAANSFAATKSTVSIMSTSF
jgi:hypothetical protein